MIWRGTSFPSVAGSPVGRQGSTGGHATDRRAVGQDAEAGVASSRIPLPPGAQLQGPLPHPPRASCVPVSADAGGLIGAKKEAHSSPLWKGPRQTCPGVGVNVCNKVTRSARSAEVSPLLGVRGEIRPTGQSVASCGRRGAIPGFRRTPEKSRLWGRPSGEGALETGPVLGRQRVYVFVCGADKTGEACQQSCPFTATGGWPFRDTVTVHIHQ